MISVSIAVPAAHSVGNCVKRLLEMSSVAGNNRIIPAIDKLDN